jgi:hypothetical protein
VAAFTMVEIAICIAIVAFAMAAIIGVLPTGVRVQKDNREETIIGQDGAFWLEAIRSGAWGLDELTNYVDLIRITRVAGPATNVEQYIYGDGRRVGATNTFRNGSDIIGLLSKPRFWTNQDFEAERQYVSAFVRALSGNAKEKPESSSRKLVDMWDPYAKKSVATPLRDVAFGYRLTSVVQPLESVPPQFLVVDGSLSPAVQSNRVALRRQEAAIEANLYELRLTLEWPVSHEATTIRVGKNQKRFDTLVSGRLHSMWPTGYTPRVEMFHFQPSLFSTPRLP